MAAKSGQRVVDTAGNSVTLGEGWINGGLLVKALAGNTGLIYLGCDEDGSVSASTGMELSAGQSVVFNWVSGLGSIWIDAAVNGEGAAWLALEF